jgi:hypothetical protein
MGEAWHLSPDRQEQLLFGLASFSRWAVIDYAMYVRARDASVNCL